MSYPTRLIPSLPHMVYPADFKAMDIDGYCSVWHYKPLAEHVCAIVRPTHIFEIGFFLGSSSYCWLSSSAAKVWSCDPIIDCAHDRDRVFRNAKNLTEWSNGRLTFINKSSADIRAEISHIPFDFAFVDGRHDVAGVREDLQLCADLKIPYILLDDYANTVAEAHQAFLHIWEPVEGYSLENGAITNPIDCLLCRLKTS